MLYMLENRFKMGLAPIARVSAYVLRFCVRSPLWAIRRYRHAAAMWRSREALLDLDDYQLDDIGITRAAAAQEASRPFWQDPAPWLQNPPSLHGDRYLAGRPAHAVRNFYQERGRHIEP